MGPRCLTQVPGAGSPVTALSPRASWDPWLEGLGKLKAPGVVRVRVPGLPGAAWASAPLGPFI